MQKNKKQKERGKSTLSADVALVTSYHFTESSEIIRNDTSSVNSAHTGKKLRSNNRGKFQ